tara:strand:- start:54058 stop:54315 length:258 start_codon:yes stop_codon:yes gene_type:complete
MSKADTNYVQGIIALCLFIGFIGCLLVWTLTDSYFMHMLFPAITGILLIVNVFIQDLDSLAKTIDSCVWLLVTVVVLALVHGLSY